MNVGSIVLLVAVTVVVGYAVLQRNARMRIWRRVVAAIFASVVGVVGAAAIVVPAGAGDPEVCGYVKYDTNGGPTSTAPGVTYCQRPCGGWFVGSDPVDHGDVYLEPFACVRGV